MTPLQSRQMAQAIALIAEDHLVVDNGSFSDLYSDLASIMDWAVSEGAPVLPALIEAASSRHLYDDTNPAKTFITAIEDDA